jgi:hypothetical protein
MFAFLARSNCIINLLKTNDMYPPSMICGKEPYSPHFGTCVLWRCLLQFQTLNLPLILIFLLLFSLLQKRLRLKRSGLFHCIFISFHCMENQSRSKSTRCCISSLPPFLFSSRVKSKTNFIKFDHVYR